MKVPSPLAAEVCLLTIVLLAVGGCASQSAPGQSAPGQSASGQSGQGAPTASSGTASSAGMAAGGVRACTTAQLKITLTNTGALGGQAGGYLRFTNSGGSACSLTGWPVVAGLTAGGKATEFRHARSTMYGAWQYSAPLPVLTLRPGSSGYAVVAADDLPAGARTSCPAPDVRLRVSAPGSTSGSTSGSEHGVLISAWLPGARSYLPTCLSAAGAQTGEVSAVTTLARLPH
jgi:hypothetical protein